MPVVLHVLFTNHTNPEKIYVFFFPEHCYSSHAVIAHSTVETLLRGLYLYLFSDSVAFLTDLSCRDFSPFKSLEFVYLPIYPFISVAHQK